jgi:hypothetical protein
LARGLSKAQRDSHPDATENTPKKRSYAFPDFKVEALTREMAGANASSEIQELARRIAEAQIDLRRVRFARHSLLSSALGDLVYDSPRAARKESKVATYVAKRVVRLAPEAARLLQPFCSPHPGLRTVAARGAAEIRDHSFRHDSAACCHGSLRTTCVVPAKVCDPGFRCGTKASRQRA